MSRSFLVLSLQRHLPSLLSSRPLFSLLYGKLKPGIRVILGDRPFFERNVRDPVARPDSVFCLATSLMETLESVVRLCGLPDNTLSAFRMLYGSPRVAKRQS